MPHVPHLIQALSNAFVEASELCTDAQVVLCASNWVVVKDCEESFDPYIFALLR